MVLMKSMADDDIHDDEQTQKLEEFMSHLQQERVKIEAFKRELPLCMHLLTNAMEELKKQLQSCQIPTPTPSWVPPVLEEFIPINNNNDNNNCEKEIVEKSHWMTTSVQLWNPTTMSSVTCNAVDDPAAAMSILPFGAGPKELQKGTPPELSLISPVNININHEISSGIIKRENRKTRRCWSPDLHRRFLNALNILGGSEVATPKQIREVMKVDGLTNDEVKSHLQKYRLHTRRPGQSSMMAAESGVTPTQVVVVGGIWVPRPEYAAPLSMIYGTGAHPTPPPPPHHHHHLHASNSNGHYCVSTAAPAPARQEFYPVSTAVAAPSSDHHHQQLMHQFHVYKPSSSSAHYGSLDYSDMKPAAAATKSIADGGAEGGGR